MEELGTGGLVGLIIGVVSLATIVARIIEKLVDRVLDDRKKKDSIPPDAVSKTPGIKMAGSYTSDLAVQRHVIETISDDVEKVREELNKAQDLLRESKSILKNDLPRMIEQLHSQHKLTHENMSEFRRAFNHLEVALEGNTAATNKLYDLLANVLKPSR